MLSKISLESVSKRASYERFKEYEPDMLKNYEQYWVTQDHFQSLEPVVSKVKVRREVLNKIEEISNSFFVVLIKKYYSYEQEKQKISFKHPLEQKIKSEAIDHKARFFAMDHMSFLLDEVEKIQSVFSRLRKHFQKFQELLLDWTEEGPEKAISLMQEMYGMQREFDQNLIVLANRRQDLANQLFAIQERGLQQLTKVSGYSFYEKFRTTPMSPMYLPERGSFMGMDPLKAIQEIEGIKEKWSVIQEVKPFYVLLLNTMESLKIMERGMAQYLAKHFSIDEALVLSNRKNDSGIFNFSIEDDLYEQKISSCLKCPLTGKLFEDPVVLETGYSFEKEALQIYLQNNDVCPRTHQKLVSKDFISNLTIRLIVQRFKGRESKSPFSGQIFETRSLLSLEEFKEPQIVSSGITYEKSEADTLCSGDKICLFTGITLDPTVRIPNLTLLELITELEKMG